VSNWEAAQIALASVMALLCIIEAIDGSRGWALIDALLVGINLFGGLS
jgi:hypothetical protein